MDIWKRFTTAMRRWREILAREILREDDVLLFHRDGDLPQSAGRGEPRVAE